MFAIVNLSADAMTVVLCIAVLKIYSAKGRTTDYLKFVIISFLIASFFSFLVVLRLSFYGNLELSIQEIFWSIFARSGDNLSWEIAPWFWYMHTTFIPLIIFTLLILMTLLAKYIVLPIEKNLYKSSIVEKPHQLTSTFLAFVGGISYCVGRIISYYL